MIRTRSVIALTAAIVLIVTGTSRAQEEEKAWPGVMEGPAATVTIRST
jgi:hypothetical protein